VNTNTPIHKSDFNKLANIHDQHCVSIYIPTFRAGEEVDRNHGQITLKNIVKNLKRTLKDYNLSKTEIENYLSPVNSLVYDSQFWRQQSDCLAIFLNKQQVKYYTLPIDQDEFTYISDHFYLLPILPIFSDDGKFFILSLSLQEVKLFESTRHSITEVYVEDLVPEKLEEVVGYDFQHKSLQFRSGQAGSHGALYHGQGAGKDDKDMETEKFFRAVDQGLMKLIKNEDAPLILACVDHYQPIYAKITNYNNLFPQNIGGNQEEKDPYLLHEMAWPLVEDYFQQRRKNMANTFRELSITGKTSFDLNDIVPAAIDGRIDVLFIQRAKDKFGLYDKVNRSLIVDEKIRISQASLYNLAAVQTWIKGGQVYVVEKDEMPLHGTNINALFRY
jgi:hypothetical protein